MAARRASASDTTREAEHETSATMPGDYGDLPGAADPADQELATVDDVQEPRPVSMSPEAAQRAANYVQEKALGPSMTQIIVYIAGKAQSTAVLNAVIMEQMAERILNAESPDDILDPFATLKGRDLLGKPLNIVGCRFLESTEAKGFPWYAALEVRDPQTGGIIPVTVGGEKLVPQAAGFDMRDAWPQVLAIHESEQTTSNGFKVLELRRAV